MNDMDIDFDLSHTSMSRPSRENVIQGSVCGLLRGANSGIEIGIVIIGPGAPEIIFVVLNVLQEQFEYAVRNTPTDRSDFCTTGLFISGRQVYVMAMDWVAGRFPRFKREEPPTYPVDIKDMGDLLTILARFPL
ncbi:hypothetical protein BG003_010109 [Podila horticola]|nr:hypothetical protein BG003_010109 [Podila horticola]